MNNSATFSSSKPAHVENQTTFNVVIAYEDFETGKHAKRTYDILQEHLGDECQFSSQMWKFDVLAVPKLREMAAKDAVAADIVIVSAHGKNELPVEVKAWIELWLLEKSRAIAIVGLFDSEEYANNPTRTYLASVAKRAKIEFFSQPGLWPQDDETFKSSEDWGRTRKAFSVLAEMARPDSEISHWGINE